MPHKHMATCRELVGTEQLSAREKSHRDPLKLREKQLRTGADVGELFQLLEDCELELAENDSVLRKVRQLYLSKEEEVHRFVEQKLQAKRNPSCRLLSSLLSQTARFGPSPLTGRLQVALEARSRSHRAPLAAELDQTVRLRDLAQLRTKMTAELPGQDDLFGKLAQLERNRQTERAQLTAKFKALVSAKKWKLSHISSLLKEAEEELEDGDALVEQIKSLLETKMQQDQGLKPVRDVERKPTASGDSKTLSKRPVASSNSSRKKPAQSSASSLSQVAGGAKSLVMGFAQDLTGAPSQSSSMYKLGILICFLMYMAVVSYSGSLAIKVAKVDLPDVGTSVQRLAESFKLRKSTAVVAVELAAVEPAAAAAGAAAGGGEEAEEEEKGGGDGGGGGGGGGGGDDDEEED